MRQRALFPQEGGKSEISLGRAGAPPEWRSAAEGKGAGPFRRPVSLERRESCILLLKEAT